MAPDDVRLCCRRNNDLLTHITEQMDKLRSDRDREKGAGEVGNKGKKTKKRKLTLEEENDE